MPAYLKGLGPSFSKSCKTASKYEVQLERSWGLLDLMGLYTNFWPGSQTMGTISMGDVV
jgi:hypothetical protein